MIQGALELYVRCMSNQEREQLIQSIQEQKQKAEADENKRELLRISIFEAACKEIWSDE